MTTKSSFISGMPELPIDSAKRQEIAGNMLRQAAFGESQAAMTVFSQVQQRRALRLANAARELSQKLGPEHPDVIAVQRMAESVGARQAGLDSQRTRVDRWPRPRPNEWTVFGTVTDAEGKPASGLIVRVFDRDRKLDDLLGETQTDESGDFRVVYHARDFLESKEGSPELYLMVSDASGKELYSSRDSVRAGAGRSEYFAIRLGKVAVKPQRKKR